MIGGVLDHEPARVGRVVSATPSIAHVACVTEQWHAHGAWGGAVDRVRLSPRLYLHHVYEEHEQRTEKAATLCSTYFSLVRCVRVFHLLALAAVATPPLAFA
jgi:hypothetical protein